MKILMFARLFWPHGGGVEKHVEMLSRELIKRGHEITLITEQYDLDLPLEDIYHGIKIYRIPYFATDSKRMVWTWMKEHDYLVESADIVHIHDVFWWYWPTRIHFLFKPVYITFHGYEGKSHPTIRAITQRKAAEICATATMCVGDFIRKWYKASPELVTYGAANNTALKKNEQILNKNSAVFWGRFDDDTGIYIYVDAMKKLKHIKLLRVFGAGPYQPMLEQVSKNTKNIQLNGFNSRIEVILGTSKYAFVSQYLAILEAMQAKRLVISVYNSQLKRDYLQCHPMRDSMIIVDSADAMVDKLETLDAANESRMIERAYEWAKMQTWNKLTNEYELLWQR